MCNITTTYIRIHSLMRTIKPQNVMYQSTNPEHNHTQYKTMQWHDHRCPHASQWPKQCIINNSRPGHLVPSLSPRPHSGHFELELGVCHSRPTRSSTSTTLELLPLLHLFPHWSLVFCSTSKILFGTTTRRELDQSQMIFDLLLCI